MNDVSLFCEFMKTTVIFVAVCALGVMAPHTHTDCDKLKQQKTSPPRPAQPRQPHISWCW